VREKKTERNKKETQRERKMKTLEVVGRRGEI
jgi:hypothetical protein